MFVGDVGISLARAMQALGVSFGICWDMSGRVGAEVEMLVFFCFRCRGELGCVGNAGIFARWGDISGRAGVTCVCWDVPSCDMAGFVEMGWYTMGALGFFVRLLRWGRL